MQERTILVARTRPRTLSHRDIYTFAQREPIAEINVEGLSIAHPPTLRHSFELAILMNMVAREGGLSEKQARTLMYSALLHDSGKAPLAKSHSGLLERQLLPGDWEKITQHPEIGYHRLSDFPDPVVPIVAYNHHKVQGSRSYPGSALRFDAPALNRYIPDGEGAVARNFWAGRRDEQAATEERMRGALEDTGVVETALWAVKWVAAMDVAQATSLRIPREYLREGLRGLNEAQVGEKQGEIWKRVMSDFSGDKEILILAMQTVASRYALEASIQRN